MVEEGKIVFTLVGRGIAAYETKISESEALLIQSIEKLYLNIKAS